MSSNKENNPKWIEMNAFQKIRYLVRNITVEPMLACYIVPCVLAGIATQNLNLEKACRVNLRYSDEVCSALSNRQTQNYTLEETQVQQLVVNMSIWKSMIHCSIPALIIMFLGSWSDRTRRRKPFMLMPIVGEIMTTISLILCVYFFYELPMEVAGFVEAFFPSITGGWTTMFMAIFSYMGDITTVESRTLRIGIVNVFCTVGVPLGTALSGILYRMLGFYGVFSISLSLYIFSFTYGLIRIKEASHQATSVDKNTNQETFSSCDKFDIQKRNEHNFFSFLKDFFDFQNIKQTFSIVFKDGPNNRKQRVTLLVIVLMVVIGPLHGKLFKVFIFNSEFKMFGSINFVFNLLVQHLCT